MQEIPFLNIRAKNNYDLGLQIGKKLAPRIKRRLTACKKIYKRMHARSFPVLVETAMKFLPATTKYFPELVAEAEGLSRGSRVPFDELMVLLCEEEVLDSKIPKCTSIALKSDHTVLVGHNEDWLDSYRHNGLYILKCAMGSHHSLSLNYMGTLPGSSCGLNSYGLCFTANSLNPGRFRFGIPIKFQFRAILESKNPRQAIFSDLQNSSIAGNTIYGWKNSRIVDVEDYFGHHEIFYGKKFLIHTNHPILKKDRKKINTETESIKRYNRAKEILNANKKFNVDALKKVLSDHEAYICSHPQHHNLWGATIASVIMNPKEQWMEVCWTNPCTNPYVRYQL